ncbi:MAG TPA: hypothetical protein PKI19_07425 [Elusimicrobiales bacterium]|nr:hypothetical protein [Elusimicrobiales bacterium]
MKNMLMAGLVVTLIAGTVYAENAAEQLGLTGNIPPLTVSAPIKVGSAYPLADVSGSDKIVAPSDLAPVPAGQSRITSLDYHARTKNIATLDMKAATAQWISEFNAKPVNYGYFYPVIGTSYVGFYVDFDVPDLGCVPENSKSLAILNENHMRFSAYKGTIVYKQPADAVWKFHKMPSPWVSDNAVYSSPSLKKIVEKEGGIVIDNGYYYGNFEFKTIHQEDTPLSYTQTVKDLSEKGRKIAGAVKPGDAAYWWIVYIQR